MTTLAVLPSTEIILAYYSSLFLRTYATEYLNIRLKTLYDARTGKQTHNANKQ